MQTITPKIQNKNDKTLNDNNESNSQAVINNAINNH